MSKPWPDLPRRLRIGKDTWRVRYRHVKQFLFRKGDPAWAYTDLDLLEIVVAVGTRRKPHSRRHVLKYLVHEFCHAAMLSHDIEEELCVSISERLVADLDAAGLLGKPTAKTKGVKRR